VEFAADIAKKINQIKIEKKHIIEKGQQYFK